VWQQDAGTVRARCMMSAYNLANCHCVVRQVDYCYCYCYMVQNIPERPFGSQCGSWGLHTSHHCCGDTANVGHAWAAPLVFALCQTQTYSGLLA
jgi:hypothetical protein